MADMVQTHTLTKRYGAGRGIQNVTFSVAEGEVFGFLGPNGAGKTTTMRTLMGLLRPTSGSAQIAGLDCWSQSTEVKRLVGYLPSEFNFDPALRGAQIVEYLGHLMGGVDQTLVKQLIERLDFDPSKRFRDYSHGNKQKVGLIQAFMHRPRLLILDEPTGGLDPLNQQAFYHLVQEVKADGRTIFLSSHILPEVEHTCDRVGIIREGELVKVDHVSTLKEIKRHVVEVTFPGPAAPEWFSALPNVSEVAHANGGNTLQLTAQADLEGVIQVAAQHHAVALTTREPSLEEAFLRYYAPDPARERLNPMLRSIFLKTIREQRWALLIWSVLVVLILVGSYKSVATIDPSQFASLIQNPAFTFWGDATAVDTVAGYVTFKYGSFFSLVLSIFALIMGSRLLRGEEARGSMDLLLATPHPRLDLLRQKVLGIGVVLLVVGLAFSLGGLLGGTSVQASPGLRGALLAGFNISLLLFFYSMLALLISQFTRTAGAAAGLTGGLYAFFFLLDASGRVAGNLAWVRYLSPNYYYDLSKPLIPSYGASAGAMAFLLVLGALLLLGSVVIFAGRDVGRTAALPSFGRKKDSRPLSVSRQIDYAARDPWLHSVLLRALRAGAPALGWWMLGAFLYAAYGAGIVKSTSQQIQDALKDSPLIRQLLGEDRLATNNGFLSVVVFLLLSIVVVVYALVRAGDWTSDQDNGRLDMILSTPQPRWRVALQSYLAVLVGLILLALAVAVGVTLGAAVTQLTFNPGGVFAASLALVPAMALVAGAVYALGARFRSATVLGIMGAYVGLAFFIDLLRTLLNLPDWVEHLSVFSAYGTPIVTGVDWTSSGVMLVLAALLVGIGVYLFQNGDMRQGG